MRRLEICFLTVVLLAGLAAAAGAARTQLPLTRERQLESIRGNLVAAGHRLPPAGDITIVRSHRKGLGREVVFRTPTARGRVRLQLADGYYRWVGDHMQSGLGWWYVRGVLRSAAGREVVYANGHVDRSR
jgi:hypothetical protein